MYPVNDNMEKPLTQHIKNDGSWLTLKEYESAGGYQALKKALQMKPAEITRIVMDSGLKGRGGAGFPTGKKWSTIDISENADTVKYLVANADEMEPGSFKDRFLLEGNPHQLIEGIIIGAYAIQASFSYVFLRWAYHLAGEALTQSIKEAYDAGYLGKNILESGF
jgi:NADH-quinone oxidoreductase subunit F